MVETLSEAEQRKYFRVLHFIFMKTRKDLSSYAEVYSGWMRKTVPNYRFYIDNLLDWKVITIKKNGKNRESYSTENGVCKLYRLTPEYRNNIIKIEYAKKRILFGEDKSQTKGDKYLEFIRGNIERLGIREELVTQENDFDTVEAEEWADSIFRGNKNIHRGEKGNRVYHEIVVMPKIARKNLVLHNDCSKCLYEYDIKTAHAVLLLGMVTDVEERKNLTALLNEDFYTSISNWAKFSGDRDRQKLNFVYFLYGGYENYYTQYFRTHFPVLLDAIRKVNKQMASKFQKQESDIMTVKVIDSLMQCNPGVLYIPMHDGWISTEEHGFQIAKIVRKYWKEATGFDVTITRTHIVTGEEIVLEETEKDILRPMLASLMVQQLQSSLERALKPFQAQMQKAEYDYRKVCIAYGSYKKALKQAEKDNKKDEFASEFDWENFTEKKNAYKNMLETIKPIYEKYERLN